MFSWRRKCSRKQEALSCSSALLIVINNRLFIRTIVTVVSVHGSAYQGYPWCWELVRSRRLAFSYFATVYKIKLRDLQTACSQTRESGFFYTPDLADATFLLLKQGPLRIRCLKILIAVVFLPTCVDTVTETQLRWTIFHFETRVLFSPIIQGWIKL